MSRITATDIRNNYVRRALQGCKRFEAGERNADTPFERRRRYRRQLAADLAGAAAKRKGRRDA